MSELEEVEGWKMSELENDEVGKCRSWLMSGWQASELDFDAFPLITRVNFCLMWGLKRNFMLLYTRYMNEHS